MSIADKLNYLITTKQLLKTEINKINNVLDDNSTFRSYPQELFNGYLDILNNGTDTLWNNLEKVSQTGTEAVLEGIETAPIKMVLNGNTSQDGTPTPDTPVEVKVVTGENVVSVSGKNLFDKSITLHSGWYNDNGVFQSPTGTSHTEEKYKVKPNETYSLSGNAIAYDTTYVFSRVYYYDKDKNWISRSAISQSSYSFTTPSNCYYIDFQVSVASGYADDYDSVKDYIQLELGSATPYVPYSKTDYTINLGNIELCKIGNYKDYLFKRNGKWYVHKEIGKKIFDGTEFWRTVPTNTTDVYRMLTTSLRGSILAPATSSTQFLAFCSRFKPIVADDTYKKIEGISCARDENVHIYMETYNTSTSVNDFKTWLSNNNVTLYYILATPTEEEITNSTLIEQLEAISNAKSVKDKTYITQTNDELPFILDVEAIKEYSVE